MHIFKKPLIVYDVSYPYTINFCGTKTIISLKKAHYNNGSPVRIEKLIGLKLKNVNKIIENKEIIFTPNSSDDIVELYQELKSRLENINLGFEKDDYKINLDWGDDIPKNVYNTYGYCQIANSCYEKQYDALSPLNQKNN